MTCRNMVCVLALYLLWGCGESDSAPEVMAQDQRPFKAQMDLIEPKIKAAEAKAEAEQKARWEEAAREQEQEASKQQMEREERRKRASAREEERRAQKEQAALEKAQRDEQKQQREAKRQEKREQDRLERQRQLKKVAEEEFSKLNLTPELLLSQSVSERGGRLKLVGRDRDKLLELYASRDWLSLVNHFLESEGDEFRSDSDIRRAAELCRKHEFHLVVELDDHDFGKDRSLVLLSLKEEDSNPIRARWNRWTPHPDGGAFVHPWSANEGTPVVALANEYGDFRIQRHALNREFQSTHDALERKRGMGEISDLEFEEQSARALRIALSKGREWALGL